MTPLLQRTVLALSLVTLAGGALAACGGDDGAGVRTVGCDPSASASGSGSAPASGSGSGSASGSEGCPSGSGSGSASGSTVVECEPVGDLETATTVVDVTLDEFAIDLETSTAPAGSIGFVATNVGEEPHELVVVKGVALDALPLDDDGALDESKLPDGALIGEIEGFPGGEECTGVFDLTPGEYTLVCNVVETEESGENESHLREGMVTTFTVT